MAYFLRVGSLHSISNVTVRPVTKYRLTRGFNGSLASIDLLSPPDGPSLGIDSGAVLTGGCCAELLL